MQFEIAECFDSVNDAINSAISLLGGYKKVGPALRPELPIDQAAGWLRDCTNASRREKLSPEQFMLILRMAREQSIHSVMNYIAFETGYKAVPVDPVSQEQELQQRFVDAVDGLTAIQAQLQRIQRVRAVA